jgi:hypothetical protein
MKICGRINPFYGRINPFLWDDKSLCVRILPDCDNQIEAKMKGVDEGPFVLPGHEHD